jgi:peptidoglycan/LPS O-acetylase OafA/YrhL
LESRELNFRGYVPGLDVLRGIAIALVVTYHGISGRAGLSGWSPLRHDFVYLTTWGSSGVNLFYVLSGFLITGILLDTAKSPDYYKRFYMHRALRIFPAYFLMLVVLKLTHTVSWPFVLAAFLYIANMSSIVGAHDSEYGSFWSLAVEEQFYLIWPLFVRRLSLSTLSRLIILYCVFAIFFRMIAMHFLPHLDLGYKLWGNADWLLYGALVAVSLRTGALHRKNITRWIIGLSILSILSLPVVPLIDLGHQNKNPFVAPFSRVPFVLLYTALLMLVIKHNKGKASADTRGPIARFFAFLGYISYGLYLVHQLVFNSYERLIGGSWLGQIRSIPSLLVGLLISGGVSIAIAYLSRRYFEQPFLNLKNIRQLRRPGIAVTQKMNPPQKAIHAPQPLESHMPVAATVETYRRRGLDLLPENLPAAKAKTEAPRLNRLP